MLWPGDRDLGVAAVILDLPLDRMDVGDGGVVEILSPDVRRQLSEKHLAGVTVAGDRPRLDQRRALPVLAEALVVLQRRLGRDGDAGRAGIGAEPEVDAEDVAVGGALVENGDQPLGQLDEDLRAVRR